MSPIKQQQGLVLVFTLIIVLVLTLSVVVGLRDSVNTQKMISSANSYQYAFELAEAATLDVYEVIEGLSDTSGFKTDDNDAALYQKGSAPSAFEPEWSDWSKEISLPMVKGDDPKPKYVIEHMNTISHQDTPSLEVPEYGPGTTTDQAEVFRVLVEATDKNGKSRQVIETFYARDFK